ncbi:fungal-specific transcription factor domain-containing protein [Trichoderma evansii]
MLPPRRIVSKRTTIACEGCRQRKIKCDGLYPQCNACRIRNSTSTCVYELDRIKTTYSASYVAALRHKLVILETAMQPTSVNGSIAAQQNASLHTNSPSQMRSSLELPPLRLALQSGEEADQRHLQSQEFQQDPMRASNSGAPFATMVPTLSPHRPPLQIEPQASPHSPSHPHDIITTEYSYPEGSFSTFNIIKQIKEAVTSRLSLSGLNARLGPDFIRDELLSHQRLEPSTELCGLLLRSEADEMMDIFWNQIHVLYPFVDYVSFQEDYEKLWYACNGNTSRTTLILLCRLNAIFALACQLRRRLTIYQSSATPDVFFRRAAQLFQMTALGNGTLEIIQACLYLTMYLQSTDYSYQCHTFIGFAINTAQSMGLNMPASAGINFEKEEVRRLRQRLWGGCILLDRIISIAFGRPTRIKQTDAMAISLPPGHGNEHVFPHSINSSGNASFVDEHYSKMDFFSESLKLFQIAGDMLPIIYSSNKSSFFSPLSDLSAQARLDDLDFNAFLRIDNSLHRWIDALPCCLQIQAVDAPLPEMDPIQIRQSVVLHLRFLQIRMLLFRPFLALILTSEATHSDQPNPDHMASLSRDVAIPCAQRCIASAVSLIDVVWIWYKENCEIFSVEPLPAWWFLILNIYNAGVVLIATRRFKSLRGCMSPAYLAQQWHRVLRVMYGLSEFSPSAKRCLVSLQLLNTEIMEETAIDPNLYNERIQTDLPRWHNPSSADMVFPEPKFRGMPSDYTWIDSLPIDLSIVDRVKVMRIGWFTRSYRA